MRVYNRALSASEIQALYNYSTEFPTIYSFTANPTSTFSTSTLTWSTAGATSVSISPGGFTSTSTATNGTTTVTIASTTIYTLTATNSSGSVTSTVTVTVSSTVPSIPTNLVATAVANSQINLTWSSSTGPNGVAGYTIFRCNGSCTPTSSIATTTLASYSDTGLTFLTQYTYTVSAFDSLNASSSQSNPVTTSTFTTTIPWSALVGKTVGYVRVLQASGGRVDYSPTGDDSLLIDKLDPVANDGYYDVFKVSFDGSSTTCLTCGAPGISQRNNGNPAYDPTGKYIAFQSQDPSLPDIGAVAGPGQGAHTGLLRMLEF